jgi:putative transposase
VRAGGRFKLAQAHHVVAVETLNADGMGRHKPGMGAAGRAINRALADASLAELRRQLAYRTHWCGSILVEADLWFASSTTCSGCGGQKPSLPLAARTLCCQHCGAVADRDTNAARNLLHLAEVETLGPGVAREAAPNTWGRTDGEPTIRPAPRTGEGRWRRTVNPAPAAHPAGQDGDRRAARRGRLTCTGHTRLRCRQRCYWPTGQ